MTVALDIDKSPFPFQKVAKKHVSKGKERSLFTAVWCKGLSELSCAILEPSNM